MRLLEDYCAIDSLQYVSLEELGLKSISEKNLHATSVNPSVKRQMA